jgi:hypothetical protein
VAIYSLASCSLTCFDVPQDAPFSWAWPLDAVPEAPPTLLSSARLDVNLLPSVLAELLRMFEACLLTVVEGRKTFHPTRSGRVKVQRLRSKIVAPILQRPQTTT